jgi:hypothetical protein
MSYDLFLRPRLGTLLGPDEKQQALDAFVAETHLDGPCEITTFRDGPHLDLGDSLTLEECFQEGEFSRSDYEAFCSARGLAPESGQDQADRAARLFLDVKWGQDVMSVKLPPAIMADAAHEAYRLIVDFARRHNLVVHDPQVGQNIDLESPGEFPPMWGP